MGNLLNAAENGLKHGAIGFLNTDWGDNGHHQPLPVSYLGYAYGAAVSWCVQANRDTDIARSLSAHVLMDPTGKAGRLLYDIGNVYTLFSQRTFNATAYGLAVGNSLDALKDRLKDAEENPGEGRRALKEIDRLEQEVAQARISRADAALVKRELAFALRLMRHGVQRRALAFNLAGRRPIKGGQDARRRLAQGHAGFDRRTQTRLVGAQPPRRLGRQRSRPGA